ncbi:acyltransferase [Fulvimonas yonginensis]|uniref:Acyltransferase n=1 Tax=Fulvimonas yonginensis TaxID=1495200 RepID=A0ABU8J934_9GAMM
MNPPPDDRPHSPADRFTSSTGSLHRTARALAKHAYRSYYTLRLSRIRGLHLGDHVLIKGKPHIAIARGASIHVGRSAVLNSSNAGYHLNMHSPVKLMADRPGARIHIGEQTRIHGSCIHAYRSVSIGRRCLIAANCQIIDCNGHELCFDDVDRRVDTVDEGQPVVIEDAVWIGANAIVLPGVRIGRGSVVAAGSVVTRNVPPRAVVAGNPARVVRRVEPVT